MASGDILTNSGNRTSLARGVGVGILTSSARRTMGAAANHVATADGGCVGSANGVGCGLAAGCTAGATVGAGVGKITVGTVGTAGSE
jgi:hypothetical protein